jgi:pimeloyl-ACP methyl ester carboxylesterase
MSVSDSKLKLILTVLLWIFIIIPGIPFVFGTLGTLTYIYWPQNFEALNISQLPVDNSRVSMFFHGLGGNTERWAQPLAEILQEQAPEGSHIALDWSDYAQSALRCSVAGKRLGRELGDRLLQAGELQHLNLVGHSCGSFVVLGICERVKQQRPDIEISTTYLDPVTVYGGIFWHYGQQHFGRCADISEAYIDTGDGVPGSNEALPYATTFDVTAERIAADFEGNPHIWPTLYYLRKIRSQAAATHVMATP